MLGREERLFFSSFLSPLPGCEGGWVEERAQGDGEDGMGQGGGTDGAVLTQRGISRLDFEPD